MGCGLVCLGLGKNENRNRMETSWANEKKNIKEKKMGKEKEGDGLG